MGRLANFPPPAVSESHGEPSITLRPHLHGGRRDSRRRFRPYATTLPVSPHDTKSLIYAIPLVRPVYSAFTEEIGFRGILQGGLEQHMRRWQAIAIATVAFVWAHSGTAWFVPEFVFYIALSVYCGLLASRTQSVLPAILLHLIVNVIGILAPLVWGPIHLREIPDMVVIPLFFVALTCIYLFRCTISRNGPARFRVNGPTLHGLPAEPRFGSFTRPFSLRQVF
jgi:hypothetical protein